MTYKNNIFLYKRIETEIKLFEKLLIILTVLLLITLIAGATSQGRDSWSYSGNSIPAPSCPSWIEASLDQKSMISFIDSSRWETRLTTVRDQFDYQMYRFNVFKPVDTITNLTAIWNGYGEAATNYNVDLYIYNILYNSWEQLDSKNLAIDGTLTGSILINTSNYIDSQGFIYIAAGARHYNYAPPAPSGLSVWLDSNQANQNYVIISWLPVIDSEGDPVEYYVEVDGAGNSGWINTTNQYFGLSPGSGYTYRVKARDTFANAESQFTEGQLFGTKSSCPFVYIWNGTEYNYITDIAGASIGAPYVNPKDYVPRYYDLSTNNVILQPQNGSYNIKLRETVAEADFLDFAKLVVADVPSGYKTFTNFLGMPSFGVGWHYDSVSHTRHNYSKEPQLYSTLVSSTRTPINAIDKNGIDVTDRFEEVDNYASIEDRNSTNEYILDFGRIEHPENAKLIVYAWIDYHTARDVKFPMMLSVINESGQWQQVADIGAFSGDLRPFIYNISNLWIINDHRIKLRPAYSKTMTLIIDKIEIDDSVPVPVDVTVVNISKADLHHRGRDRYEYSTLTERIQAYDEILPDDIGSYFYGNFTKYGEVEPLLNDLDDKSVIFRHGDEIILSYPEVPTKNGYDRKFFLYTLAWYSLQRKIPEDNGFLRDIVTPLPFYGMTAYPYNTSIENYPYDAGHVQYINDWNTRVCEDRVSGTCYNSTTGEQNIDGLEIYRKFLTFYPLNNEKQPAKSENVSKKPLPRSLNTNYVELKVNNQLLGNFISNVSSATTLSSSYITWINDVASDNRVYYGLNEADVNNLVNGSWSVWNNNSINPKIRVTGLLANTTYYYRPMTWYLGTVNNSVKATFITAKPGVWTSPAEYVVSPAGWIGSPQNFRTINISAAPLNVNGRYISGLSLEAVIYNSSSGELGRINLSGNGPYTGNFTLPDYYLEESGYVTIPGYPIAADFSVLKWNGCLNCHLGNNPSTFNASILHPKHIDTTLVNTWHPDPLNEYPDPPVPFFVASTETCHVNGFDCRPYWTSHPIIGTNQPNDPNAYIECKKCHISPSGNNPAVACQTCHNDSLTNQSLLSYRYGPDKHTDQLCSNCHGNLTSINAKPNCSACHPRPGSNLTSVPDSIENKSHSIQKTVDCGFCHNREHDIKSLTMEATLCKGCHGGITHDRGSQCTNCHGNDPHNITFSGTDCIACHEPNDVNISKFVRHANINTSDGPGNVTNNDCWTCHYQKDMNTNHVYLCDSCHTNNTGIVAVNDPALIVSNMQHGSNTCKSCHAPDMYHFNGTAGPRGKIDKLGWY